MNIILTPEQEKYIQSQLEEGKYNSIEQLISEALQLLEERNCALEEKRLGELKQKIDSGTEQIARGQVTGGEVAFAQSQEKIRLISESEVILSDDNPRRQINQRVQELFKQKGRLQGARENLITILETRFGELPSSLIDLINHIESYSLLMTLHRQAITIGSVAEFQEMLAQLISQSAE